MVEERSTERGAEGDEADSDDEVGEALMGVCCSGLMCLGQKGMLCELKAVTSLCLCYQIDPSSSRVQSHPVDPLVLTKASSSEFVSLAASGLFILEEKLGQERRRGGGSVQNGSIQNGSIRSLMATSFSLPLSLCLSISIYLYIYGYIWIYICTISLPLFIFFLFSLLFFSSLSVSRLLLFPLFQCFFSLFSWCGIHPPPPFHPPGKLLTYLLVVVLLYTRTNLRAIVL